MNSSPISRLTSTSSSPSSPISPGAINSRSRRVMLELKRDIEGIRTQSFHKKLLNSYQQQRYCEALDRIDAESTKAQESMIEDAYAKHSAMREEAERLLQWHHQVAEEQKQRAEQEEKLRKEQLARMLAEKEARDREEQAKQHARIQAEKEKAAAQEEARRKAEEAEQARLAAEKERKQKEESLAAEARAKEEAEQAAKDATARSLEATSYGKRTEVERNKHTAYLELHTRLKKLREYTRTELAKNNELKAGASEMRRHLQPAPGKLVMDDKEKNRSVARGVIGVLKQSLEIPFVTVDVRQYMVDPAPSVNDASSQVSALFIFLVNHFAKALISQIAFETSSAPETAETIAILAVTVFSDPSLCFEGLPFIDIFLCKYHLICPVIFGFYGPESTVEGRDAIGWQRVDKSDNTLRAFQSAEKHITRMQGFGYAWAALSLRKFGQTARRNPIPNTEFWAAVAYIVDVPPTEVQTTHLYVLGALLRSSAPRIVGFWGDLGRKLLHHALVEFPKTLPARIDGVNKLDDVRTVYASNSGIFI